MSLLLFIKTMMFGLSLMLTIMLWEDRMCKFHALEKKGLEGRSMNTSEFGWFLIFTGLSWAIFYLLCNL